MLPGIYVYFTCKIYTPNEYECSIYLSMLTTSPITGLRTFRESVSIIFRTFMIGSSHRCFAKANLEWCTVSIFPYKHMHAGSF